MNQWFLATRQINNNRLRSALMAVGVAAFSAVVVAVTLLVVGIYQSIDQTVNRLGADMMLVPRGEQVAMQFNEALITGKPTSFYVPAVRMDEVASLDGIERISAQTYAQTLTNARCCAGHFLLVGFDRDSDFTVLPWLKETPTLWPGEEQDWIIVGDRILLDVGEDVQLYGGTYRVAGVLRPTGTGMDWTVYVPNPVLRRMVVRSRTEAVTPLEIDPQAISAIFIRVSQGVDLIDMAERLESRCPDCQAVLSSSVGALARAQLTVVAVISLGIVGVLWGVAALLSGVVFAQAVRERQSEIGLFMAKGAHHGFVLGMLIKESLLISLVASLSGAALSVLIVVSFRELLSISLGVPHVLPDPTTVCLLVLGLCALGTATAVGCACLPAFALLRREPFESIKGGAKL